MNEYNIMQIMPAGLGVQKCGYYLFFFFDTLTYDKHFNRIFLKGINNIPKTQNVDEDDYCYRTHLLRNNPLRNLFYTYFFSQERLLYYILAIFYNIIQKWKKNFINGGWLNFYDKNTMRWLLAVLNV